MIDEWKGDHILWFGDECSVSEQSSNNVIRNLYAQSKAFGHFGDVFGMICESYRNISCFFKEAEKNVREEIGYYLNEYKKIGKLDHYNENGINLEKPYEGLFLKHGRRYQFTINHSKKVYYTLDETDILFQDHTRNVFSDSLPILMGYGKVAERGEWLGDVIGVSDKRPEGYSLIKEMYVDW